MQSNTYEAKTNAIVDAIQAQLAAGQSLQAVSRSIRRLAGEQHIDSAELAAGIKAAVKAGIITTAQAEQL